MRKRDILISILIGIFTGAIWAGVLVRLHALERFHIGFAVWGLVVVAPIAFVFGLYLGQWLSRWKHFFVSFARFAIVGFFNTGIDFGVFNLLMFVTKVEKGIAVSSFKTVSFIAAVINSYFWNKYWVFEASSSKEGLGREFFKFIVVNVIGLVINVSITSVLVIGVAPKLGFSQLAWNNIAAVVGTVFGLIWNFIGFRLIVFKKEAKIESVTA